MYQDGYARTLDGLFHEEVSMVGFNAKTSIRKDQRGAKVQSKNETRLGGEK